jgi:hypothetical protein
MATLNLQVAASANDYVSGSTLTATVLNLTPQSGFRFTEASELAGTALSAATLQFYFDDRIGSPTYRIYGHKATTSAAFSAGEVVGDRPKTTAYVEWAPTSITGWITTPDLSAVVQEVANQEGWDGNLTFILRNMSTGGPYIKVRAYDYAGNAHGAKFAATYSYSGSADFTLSLEASAEGYVPPRASFDLGLSMLVRTRSPIPHSGNGSAITGTVTTPTGVTYPVTDTPSCKWSVKGGPVTAEFDLGERDDLLRSEVRLFDESGIGWHGWVWDAPKDGRVTAIGSAAPLSMTKRAAYYCDTSVNDYRADVTAGSLSTNVEGEYVRILADKGRADYRYFGGIAFKEVPATNKCRLTFSWTRPDTNWEIRGLAYGVGTSQVAAGSGLSGTATLNATDTDIVAVLLQAYCTGTTSYSADGAYVSFYNIKYYGVERDGTLLTTIRPDTVLTDCIGRLPSWAFPADSEWLSWIEASSVTVEPLTFEETTDTEKVSEAVKYDSMDYLWASAYRGMEQRFVPVYTARETTPSLALDLSRVAHDFTEADMEALASRVLVKYHDADGRSKSLIRTDTDESHYLVRIGCVMDAEITVDTTSATIAAAMGDLALAEMGASTARGSVKTTYLRSANGSPLTLSDARCGSMLDLGERTSRVTAMERKGASVSLTFDDEPYRLSTTLAQLSKR